jgi:hypothetical protein
MSNQCEALLVEADRQCSCGTPAPEGVSRRIQED